MRRYKETYRALLAIAGRQGGYFTAQQALSVGYAYPEQHYHVAQGNWERVQRGIYRLRDYPLYAAPERDDLIVLTLLSCNRAGEPQAVVSHETALSVHEISDANPARIHLTVPPDFRKRMPPGVVLHRGDISVAGWEEHEGYRVTTPLHTILDIAASPQSWVYLDDAIRDALRRGLVRREQLLDVIRAEGEDNEPMNERLHTALGAALTGQEQRTLEKIEA